MQSLCLIVSLLPVAGLRCLSGQPDDIAGHGNISQHYDHNDGIGNDDPDRYDNDASCDVDCLDDRTHGNHNLCQLSGG